MAGPRYPGVAQGNKSGAAMRATSRPTRRKPLRGFPRHGRFGPVTRTGKFYHGVRGRWPAGGPRPLTAVGPPSDNTPSVPAAEDAGRAARYTRRPTAGTPHARFPFAKADARVAAARAGLRPGRRRV